MVFVQMGLVDIQQIAQSASPGCIGIENTENEVSLSENHFRVQSMYNRENSHRSM
jgi:hypothetical protein